MMSLTPFRTGGQIFRASDPRKSESISAISKLNTEVNRSTKPFKVVSSVVKTPVNDTETNSITNNTSATVSYAQKVETPVLSEHSFILPDGQRTVGNLSNTVIPATFFQTEC